MDIAPLLEAVSPDAPCGVEGSLFVLEDLVKEQGSGVVDGAELEQTEPSWSSVYEESVELLKEFKHLRTTLFLSLALLKKEGLPGFRDGIVLIGELMDQYWEDMYPTLDPDESMGDKDGWLERENILGTLDAPIGTMGDPFRFLTRLQEVPLCNSRQLGHYSLKDIQKAAESSGQEGEDGGEAADVAVIRAAFEDTETEELKVIDGALDELISTLAGIRESLSKRLQFSVPPTFSNLLDLLAKLKKPVSEEVDRRKVFEGDDEASEDGEQAGRAAQGAAFVSAGGVSSRDEVLKALDAICKYYEKMEPSSPVPLLIRRAQRLVTKNFLEILEDISPAGIAEVRQLSGKQMLDMSAGVAPDQEDAAPAAKKPERKVVRVDTD